MYWLALAFVIYIQTVTKPNNGLSGYELFNIFRTIIYICFKTAFDKPTFNKIQDNLNI